MAELGRAPRYNIRQALADVTGVDEEALMNESPVNEKILEVQPAGRGEVLNWLAFQRKEIKPGRFWNSFLTTALTDAVTGMWEACRELDPQCRRTVEQPNGFYSAYFKVLIRGEMFEVMAERQLVRGGWNPFAAEVAKNYRVTFTIRASDRQLLERVVEKFREISPAVKVLRET